MSARSVENIILKLRRPADYNVERAQRGIVYIDEVDKISASPTTPRSRVTCRRGVQQALLNFMEAPSPPCRPRAARKHPQAGFLQSTPPTYCSLRRRLRRPGEDHLRPRQGLVDRLRRRRPAARTSARPAEVLKESSRKIC